MSLYRFIFYNSKARAEPTRLIFAQAGVEYVDERIKGEDWPTVAPRIPFGSLPVLEVDGRPLSGTLVIERYLGVKHGLGGADDFENALIDSALDALSDMVTKFKSYWFDSDVTRKVETKKRLDESRVIPETLDNLEKFVASNKDGWLVGSKLTYGDINVYYWLDVISKNWPEPIVDNYPSLSQLVKRVEAQPRIAKWIKERPVTNT